MTLLTESTIKNRQEIVTKIGPPAGWGGADWAEVYRYRELLWYLTIRNVKAKYKQTLLGPIWIVLMPLVTSGIFSLVLGALAGLPSGDIPYPVFVYSGMVLWTLMASAVSTGATCLRTNQNLLTKVYFPRLILPIVAALSGLIDFLLGAVLLLVGLLVTGLVPGWQVLFAPVFVLLALLTGLAIGLWLAALGVRFRDITHGGQFISRIWMWLTPVAFSSSLVLASDRLSGDAKTIATFIFQLNPMFVVIEGWRWSILGQPFQGDIWIVPIALIVLVIMLFGGLKVFNRVESTFADVV